MKERIKLIAYWVTTILGPASFVIGGILFITQDEQVLKNFSRLGYPTYLTYIVGVWKICGAVVAVIPKFPRLKEWMYIGFFFELTTAAVSHVAVGDPFIGDGNAQILSPLVFLALVIASWALRPASRRV